MKERNDGFQHLREQLKNFEAEVPSAGWKEMAAILDGDRPVPQPTVADRPRRRFAGWIWLAGAFFLLGGSFWLSARQEARMASESSPETVLSALPVPVPQTIKESSVVAAMATVADATSETPSAANLPGTAPPAPPKPVDTSPGPEPAQSAQLANRPVDSNETPDDFSTDKADTISTDIIPDSMGSTVKRIFAGINQLPTLPSGYLEKPTAAIALPDIFPANHHRWNFGLKAGADYQPLQANALLGAFAQFRIHPDWVVEAGLQYKRRSETNGQGLGINPPPGDTVYFPAFASIASFHRPISRVHFFEAPFTLQYQVTGRIRVLGGIKAAYLHSTDRQPGNFASNSSFGQENMADLANNRSAASETKVERFEKWDLGLIAGLDYRIASHWTLELTWQQGLRDLTPNSFYQNDEVYNNSSLQFALKWYW